MAAQKDKEALIENLLNRKTDPTVSFTFEQFENDCRSRPLGRNRLPPEVEKLKQLLDACKSKGSSWLDVSFPSAKGGSTTVRVIALAAMCGDVHALTLLAPLDSSSLLTALKAALRVDRPECVSVLLASPQLPPSDVAALFFEACDTLLSPAVLNAFRQNQSFQSLVRTVLYDIKPTPSVSTLSASAPPISLHRTVHEHGLILAVASLSRQASSFRSDIFDFRRRWAPVLAAAAGPFEVEQRTTERSRALEDLTSFQSSREKTARECFNMLVALRTLNGSELRRVFHCLLDSGVDDAIQVLLGEYKQLLDVLDDRQGKGDNTAGRNMYLYLYGPSKDEGRESR